MSSLSPSFECFDEVFEESVDSQEDSSSSSTSMVRADDASAVENFSDERTLSDPPCRIGYVWVHTQVTNKCSKYKWLHSLKKILPSLHDLLPEFLFIMLASLLSSLPSPPSPPWPLYKRSFGIWPLPCFKVVYIRILQKVILVGPWWRDPQTCLHLVGESK